DILYLIVLGRPIIAINDPKFARELIDKRGGNCVDRPPFLLFELSVFKSTSTSHHSVNCS
ncbi:hypothetical protein BJ878DRAFT_415749, partial [Calycina marina]